MRRLVGLLLVSFAACTDEVLVPPLPPSPPAPGQTDFISADGKDGALPGRNVGLDERAGAPAAGGETRTVEEGDIYRLGADGKIYNLNSYRGLQIIDVSDTRAPRILGKLSIAGLPVEMYLSGDRAYLLLNDWQGFYTARDAMRPERYQGGLVVAVDVSDPSRPIETARVRVPGTIKTSRLTRGGGGEALYVAAAAADRSVVKSLTLAAGGALAPKTELDLGGYVTDIMATPSRLVVARSDYLRHDGRSELSVVDISDPQGAMVAGTTFVAEGLVAGKTRMDLRGNVLRVASWESAAGLNHVETFDVADIRVPLRIDHETFGLGQQLFATLFLEDRAFFVTYERRDPFHAFAIDAAGQVEARSEFVVSGWNDWFRAVSGERRLIGIGKNDERGLTLAVSLYDITDLDNPTPLIGRADVALMNSWSEASFDDRAFSVLEDAVSIAAPTGQIETGLVLLPFSGWDGDLGYVSGVQLFTFSDATITRRGVLEEETPVRRSFLLESARAAANLSEEELGIFDASRPDAPVEVGRLELAPDYSGVLVYGTYAVRRHTKSHWTRYWSGHTATLPEDQLEVVSLASDLDAATPLAMMRVRAGARIFKVGSKLAAVSYVGDGAAPGYRVQVEAWDLSSPRSPVFTGKLDTRELPLPGYGYARMGVPSPVIDCLDCGWGIWYLASGIEVVGGALVFVRYVPEDVVEGTVEVRWVRPSMSGYCSTEQSDCTYLTGQITCEQLTRVNGTTDPSTCSGTIQSCTVTASGGTTCTEVAPDSIATQEGSYSYERHRYWMHYELQAVDVAGVPALAGKLSTPADEEGVSMLVRGTTLYVTHKRPVLVPGDGRPHARFHFRAVDWSDPATPRLSPSVNIPGELIAVDGNMLVTRDSIWGEHAIETSIDQLELSDGLAHLWATHQFTDRVVEKVLLGGGGTLLVSNGEAWIGGVGVAVPGGVARTTATLASQPSHRLTILDLAGGRLATLGEAEIDAWASLAGAIPGRALFTVSGGLLVVNLDDPRAPFAQAYFPMSAWGYGVELTGRTAILPAGRYGLFRFDLDTSNLLPATAQ